MEFPLEVYSLIARHVERPTDLRTLCLVSKGSRRAAERALYRKLDVRELSTTTMLCRILAEQPRLSQLVISLTISLNEELRGDSGTNFKEQKILTPLSDSDYWTSVSKALQKTTRLRSLRIYVDNGIPSKHAWILSGCSFQLHTFHCDLAWDAHLIFFLSEQRKLFDLRISDFNEENPENVSISTHSLRQARTLPSLSILDCTFTEAVGVFVPGRPVTHVKTCFSSSNPEAKRVELALLLADLRLSTQPLRSLTVADEAYTTAFSLELLSSLVKAFGLSPQLRYVGPLALPVDGRERLVFYGYLARLRGLRSAELDVSEWEPRPESFAALRGLARELHLFVPSIVTLIFVRDLEPTVLRAANGLWQVADDIIADTLWRIP
ncbi:hypothetical protein B0F90DRAFT_1811921 [Multifurca ochricompacta]|uniref:F-box domain-containing protein n=1 Tax=Multifurca ochricompacta TaxID=376703 RepID=A0AAD4QIK2_9AGAM|nr:hypothetical protein B0F90DRAFT_1811921 [Multifurca ochricompacta]